MTRRGLSVFSDEEMKKRLTEKTHAPIFCDNQLVEELKQVIDDTSKTGAFETVISRTKQLQNQKTAQTGTASAQNTIETDETRRGEQFLGK